VLNVASTIAFQPAPGQAVYGASKAFVLSFTEALWAETRGSGVHVTALCPGPTRTGFSTALGADVSSTRIYRRLTDPGPVVDAGLAALDAGRSHRIPGRTNYLSAQAGRLLPRAVLTLVSARLLSAPDARRGVTPPPPVQAHNQSLATVPPERAWALLSDVAGWPAWYRACRWTRPEPLDAGGLSVGSRFTWKAHPLTLHSMVTVADPPRTLQFIATAPGLRAVHTFTLTPARGGVWISSHETQTGPLPNVGRRLLSANLSRANQGWLDDLIRTAASVPHPPSGAVTTPVLDSGPLLR
jgi:hypothetical protein